MGMIFITGRNKREWFNEYSQWVREFTQKLQRVP